jgi:putative hydrolase of the HAD superfamily
MNRSDPRDVVFDIGNVLLFFDFGIFVRKIAAECQVPAPEVLERLRSPMWELEARGLPVEEFYGRAAGEIGYGGRFADFVAAWQEIFEPNEPMMEFATRLKRDGHRIFLLSNTNPWHVEHFLARYPVFGLFDDRVFSHEERCAKPEARIFGIARDRFGVVPENTLYIDDRLENVEAGRETGFRVFHYVGQGIEELRAAVNG